MGMPFFFPAKISHLCACVQPFGPITNGMKRFFNLLLLSLFLSSVSVVSAAAEPDSLHVAPAQMPAVTKPEALRNTILEIYAAQPETALRLTRRLIRLPDNAFPLQEKVLFCRNLSEKFAQEKLYQQAYTALKIADSLQTASALAPKSATGKSPGFPAGLLFFFTALLAGTGWLIYLYLTTRKTSVALQKAKKETEELQTKIREAEKEIEKRLNEQTSEIRKELEKLRAREVELKTNLKKTEEANYLRNAFIANLGFDVRTPLSGIIGFANMLETELAVKENQELYDYAASIEKSGSRLLKLLDNVIDLSALESNRLTLKIKPVAPEKVIHNVVEQYKPLAINKNLIFKSKVEKELNTVLADENGLKKALVQIIDNAIKYTEKGFVTVSAAYAEESDTDMVQVKDTGPGIPAEKQKNLFDISLSGEAGEGTGIGLKLAKKYIEMMKGSLFLESVPGKGTTVTLHLPCSEEAVAEAAEGEAKAETEHRKEVTTAVELGDLDIFVVEDDRMNRIILEKMLKPLGKVTLTVDGEDCMNTIAKEAEKGHYFQVMLFDINLPGDWDGIKLLKAIREKYPDYRKIPFIAQTAYAMAGDKERLLKEGFDSYLAKPIDKNELITTIKQQLQIYGG